MTIARDLSQLRIPVQPTLGGVSPGYIDGLNWRWTNFGVFTVDSGAAWCPYETGGRLVVLPASITVTVPTGTPFARTHLWLHNDNGTPTVVSDEVSLTDNYFGDAWRHPTNKGWRYLGSLLRNSAGDVFAQSCNGNNLSFHIHVAQAPFAFVDTTAQVAARTVSVASAVAPTAFEITFTVSTTGAVCRMAASPATAAGNTVSSGWFTQIANGGQISMITLGIGRDTSMQYSNDTATGAVVMRITSYRFRR